MENISNMAVFEFQLLPSVIWATRHAYLLIVCLGGWLDDLVRSHRERMVHCILHDFVLCCGIVVYPFSIVHYSSVQQSMGIYK